MTQLEWWNADFGNHDGGSADMTDIPRLFDTQPLPEPEIIDNWGNNAGAGDECDIESTFNEMRRLNEQEEINDPDCAPDNAEQILNDLNS